MDEPLSQDLLALAAERWPESIALRAGGDEWTYQELDYAASEVAGRVPAGERIAFRAEPTVATVVAVWGIPRGGGIAVPLDASLEPAPAAAIAERLGATLGHPEPGASVRAEVEPDDGRPALIISTSGSRGEPRGVLITFGNIKAAAFASQLHLGSRHGETWLLALPMHHVGGLSILWRAAHDGAAVSIHGRFDASRFIAELGKGVEWGSVVPTMLRRLVSAADGASYHALRGLLVGGASAAEDVLLDALAVGLEPLATYGMTETTAQLSTVHPGTAAESIGTVGYPLPGVNVTIDAPPGQVGPIHVDGPTVSPGYADAPPRQGPLETNDLGFFDAAGRLVVTGRADDVIISGGENVHPVTVENALLALPGVSCAVVFGVSDPEWGEAVVAVVEGEGLDPARVRSAAAEQLAAYAVPKEVHVVESIPLMGPGKPDRRAAMAMVYRGPSSGS